MIILAVDNDKAGREFCQKIRNKGFPIQQDLPPLLKIETKADWNDVVKKQSEVSLAEVIHSAQTQILNSNAPPKTQPMLEM